VLPDGRVTFCTALHDQDFYDLGNLNYQSIAEMWSSDKALMFANPNKEDMEYSACYECKDFNKCYMSNGKCHLLVANSYGIEKFHNPDPRCPHAPKLINSIHNLY
jgi:radical SAM protein with 4Fe4S-binding SPASM domain